MSRLLKELQSLAPFSWDKRSNLFPPGKESMKDFREVEGLLTTAVAMKTGRGNGKVGAGTLEEETIHLNEAPVNRKRKAAERVKGLVATIAGNASDNESDEPAPTPRPQPKRPQRQLPDYEHHTQLALSTPAHNANNHNATSEAAAALLAIGRSAGAPSSSPAMKTPAGNAKTAAGAHEGPVSTPAGLLEVSPPTAHASSKTALGSAARAPASAAPQHAAARREFVTPMRPLPARNARGDDEENLDPAPAHTQSKAPKARRPAAPAPPPQLALPLAELPRLTMPAQAPRPNTLVRAAEAPKLFKDTPVKPLPIPPAPVGPFYSVVTLDPYAQYRNAVQRAGAQGQAQGLQRPAAPVALSPALQQALQRLKEMK